MDFKTVAKHTLPSIIKIMGGEDAAISLMEKTFKGLEEQDFKFEKAEVLGVSEIVKEQGQFRCYIKGKNQMKMGNQRIFSESYLLGIYNEKDNYWWFLEAKELKNSGMTDQVLPNFETQLNIPEDTMKMETIEN